MRRTASERNILKRISWHCQLSLGAVKLWLLEISIGSSIKWARPSHVTVSGLICRVYGSHSLGINCALRSWPGLQSKTATASMAGAD